MTTIQTTSLHILQLFAVLPATIQDSDIVRFQQFTKMTKNHDICYIKEIHPKSIAIFFIELSYSVSQMQFNLRSNNVHGTNRANYALLPGSIHATSFRTASMLCHVNG